MSKDEEKSTEISEIEVKAKKELELIKKFDKQHKQKIKTNIQQHSQEDYEFARASIYDSIEKLTGLLDSAITVASETEAPRSIEVATALGKAIIDSSKELIGQQKDLAEVTEKAQELTDENNNTGIKLGSNQKMIDSGGNGPSVNNGGTVNIQMTTSDLMDMLTQAEEESNSNPIDVTPPKDT